MSKAKKRPANLPETFETIEEMADFWDTHDLTDYGEFLTPVAMSVAVEPTHEYVITLSDSLNARLRSALKTEGVPLNTLVNLWVQEKLQHYPTASPT